ncbi:DNA recombination protein RmuC [Aureispira anguillae]|uniref:DNA recombination protein RmuC n=1 Tax=Aureispira anguillae TaxID=2864201 RepID=A0A915YLE4_9BACT|nr:DNA recombination protein RmuC [Aureispira anguillae]BDS15380.1 DNA recombination protein RmuC [Aureispira anguillae]
MELLYLGIGIFIGLLLGYLIGILKTKNSKTSDDNKYILREVHQSVLARIEKLEHTLEDKEIECIDLNKALAGQEQIIYNQKEKLKDQDKNLQQIQEQLRLEFSNTANLLLEEKSQKFTTQNQENLDNLLKPLQEKLLSFEQKVEYYYSDQTKDRATLKEQIRNLTQLNQQMNEETRNLTNALKGEAKTQGNWGELILERILEKSGLRKDAEYFTQSHYLSEEGRHQFPDLILNLPNKKHLVIDSKMSLTAYERFCSAATDVEAQKALKEHLTSVKKHVKELSVKKYQQIHELNTVDFVLMFVPLEAAFALAMQNDHNLFYQAFEQNVIIVSPMTLLVTTRTISNVWQQENQNRHALEIAQQAGRMYDKFVNFVGDLEQIGAKIQTVEQSYNEAMKKLQFGKGNLIGRATKLKELGAKTSKQLPDKFEDNG